MSRDDRKRAIGKVVSVAAESYVGKWVMTA